jgi:hypothetical protein
LSRSQTISRLETLLERIRVRAGQPRAGVRTAAAAPSAQVAPFAQFAPPAQEESPAPTVPPPADIPLPADMETTLVQRARSPLATEADVVVDVDVQEVSAEAVIDVGADEVVVAESMESRERLVAAEPVAESDTVTEVVPPEVLEESPADVLSAVEEVEEAPLSSRRPVALQPEERLADMAFGAEEPRPPRHTPPPESGRLPAAPDVEFEADVTGVREATPIAVAVPPVSHLVPETTRADLGGGERVPDVVGAAQRFSPSTFTALLDASLAL